MCGWHDLGHVNGSRKIYTSACVLPYHMPRLSTWHIRLHKLASPPMPWRLLMFKAYEREAVRGTQIPYSIFWEQLSWIESKTWVTQHIENSHDLHILLCWLWPCWRLRVKSLASNYALFKNIGPTLAALLPPHKHLLHQMWYRLFRVHVRVTFSELSSHFHT